MARAWTLTISLGLVAVFMLGSRWYPTEAMAQRPPRPAAPPAVPQFLAWPLPATGKAYATIDGKHLWQYVKDQA